MATPTKVSGPAARAIFDHMLSEGIKRNADIIAPIWAAGDIAVVVLDPLPAAKEAARSLGWDGFSPVFGLASGQRKRFAANLHRAGDAVSAAWLRATPPVSGGRIFMIYEGGTFLINYDAGKGYSLAPGSDFVPEPS